MRGFDLAKVATAAEVLRLQRLVRRQAVRGSLAVGALVFALAAFAMLNSVAYLALILFVSPWIAALIVFVIDLVIAGVLVMTAIKSAPSSIEIEAVAIRRKALAEIEPTLKTLSLLRDTGGLVFSARRALRGEKLDRLMLLAEVAARFLRQRWLGWASRETLPAAVGQPIKPRGSREGSQ